MKPKILVSLVILCVACAAPKHYYNFDYVSQGSKKDGKTSQVFQTNPSSLTASVNNVAIVDIAPVVLAEASTVQKPSALAPNLSERKQAKVAKLVARMEAKHSHTDQPPLNEDGDKSKNGWAIAGFILSIAGWLLLWPFIVLGIIFSAIGLKSQKRGMAIAGLVIGLAGLVVILIAGSQGKI